MGLPAEDFDFVGSYNNQLIKNIDSERTINCFEYHDTRAKKKKSLIGTSGLLNTNFNFVNVTGGFRGEYVFNNIHYIVIGGFTGIAGGSTVFSVDPTGATSVAVLGNIPSTNSGYVGIDANTFQVIFVDGVAGYVYDTLAKTFLPITDTSFPPNPLDVCYLDGFTVVIHGSTNQFQLSSLYQSMVWGPAANSITATLPSTLTVGASTLPGGVSGTANYATGIPVTVSVTGSGVLPSGLTTGVVYYVIQMTTATIALATSYDNARMGVAISLVDVGTAPFFITSQGQLQQGQVNSHPGTLVACRTLHRRIFFFSQFFIEPWENAGLGTNLPVRRNNSLLIENGTFAASNVTTDFDILCYVSQSRGGLGSVMMISGTESIPISTRALNTRLGNFAALGIINDCRTFLIKENGLIFFRMNFTAANHTFVYNVSQSRPDIGDEEKYWHEEEILNGNRHPAQTHVYYNGLNYAGDFQSPILYQVSPNVYTNNGEVIRRARITKPIMVEGGNRRRIDRIVIDFQQGNVALQNNPVANVPFVFLSISKDGGQSYKYQQKAPLGPEGERTYRTIWRKLGVIPREQAFVCMMEFFTPIPFVCLGASWVTEVLPQ